MIKSVIAFIATAMIVFLSFAFILWDINPANWDTGTRALSVILGSTLGILSVMFLNDI